MIHVPDVKVYVLVELFSVELNTNPPLDPIKALDIPFCNICAIILAPEVKSVPVSLYHRPIDHALPNLGSGKIQDEEPLRTIPLPISLTFAIPLNNVAWLLLPDWSFQ